MLAIASCDVGGKTSQDMLTDLRWRLDDASGLVFILMWGGRIIDPAIADSDAIDRSSARMRRLLVGRGV